MATARKPGTETGEVPQHRDTVAASCSAPGAVGTGDYHQWTVGDAVALQVDRWWQAAKGLVGKADPPSSSRLAQFKNAWVRFHRRKIIELSAHHRLPPEILGGIAWTEVGGSPDIEDRIVFGFRDFDHLGDPFLEPLTITKRPEMTSIGDVAIQIRNIARVLGHPGGRISRSQQAEIIQLMTNEECNLAVVAKHLADALEKVMPNYRFEDIGDQEFMLCGYIYNLGYPHALLGRGKDLAEIPRKGISNYGHDLLKKRARIRELLEENFP